MYVDQQLRTYLDDLASGQSTPGGGSTAALNGAMGAALILMVARLTTGKAEYAAVQQELETLQQRVERQRGRFQDLVQEDIEAYGRLSSCFKMPRSTDEEKAARSQAIQSRLVEAASVPLEMAEQAAELIRDCQRIAEIGSKNLLSDIATSALLISTSATAASWMVRANVMTLKDKPRAEELQARLDAALATVANGSKRALEIVEGRS